MKSNKSNQTGHWESTAIARLNDEIMSAAGIVWSDWTRCDLSTVRTSVRKNFIDDIVSTLSNEFPRGRSAVLKDPRICRLFDLYQSAFLEHDIAVNVVIPFRNPLAVIASLKARNGISELDAGFLWLRHILDAVHSSRDSNRAYVNYEALLSQPIPTISGVLDRLNVTTPYKLEAVSEQILDFVNPDLKHHEFTTIDVAHSPHTEGWVSEAYEAMLVLSKEPDSQIAIDRLSELYSELNQANDLLKTVSMHSRLRIDAQVEETQRLQAELEADRESLRGLTEENENLKSEVDALTNRHEVTQNALTQSEERLEQSQESLQQTQESLQQTQESLQQTQESLQQTQESLQQSEERLGQTQETLERSQEELTARDQELSEKEILVDSQNARIAEADEQLAASLAETVELQQRFETLQTSYNQLDETLDREQQRLIEESNARSDLAAKLTEAVQRSEEIEARADQLEQELNVAVETLSETAAELESSQRTIEEANRSADELLSQLDRSESELQKTETLRDELQTKIFVLNGDLAAQIDRSETLQTELNSSYRRHESELETVKKLSQHKVDDAMAAQERAIDAMTTELRDSRKHHRSARADLDDVLPRLKSREKELRQLQRQFWRLKDELSWAKEINQSLQSSTSWKLTAPLRSAVRMARNLKPGANVTGEIPDRTAAQPKSAPSQEEPTEEPSSNGSQAVQRQDLDPIQTPKPPMPKVGQPDLVRDIGLLERSSSFDKAYYLAEHPEAALHPQGPEGHYLLEGWKRGFRPNPTFETNAYLASHPELKGSDVCPLIHYIKSGGAEPLNGRPRTNGSAAIRTNTGTGRVAVFTAISNGYDDLKEPEIVSDNADYFVFTDGNIPSNSRWKPMPFEFVSHDPTRTARFVKTHPHLYFKDYDWAIWVDANLQLASTVDQLLPEHPEEADFYTWHHPLRDCVFEEAEECIKRNKDDAPTIKAQAANLQAEGFPKQVGLYETSVLVTKMNVANVEDMYNAWWGEISKWSKRDQLSLPVATRKTGLKVGYLARDKICMRTDWRFVYYRHAPR